MIISWDETIAPHIHQNFHSQGSKGIRSSPFTLVFCLLLFKDSLFNNEKMHQHPSQNQNPAVDSLPFKVKFCVGSCVFVFSPQSMSAFSYQVLWPLQTARALLVSGYRGEQTSVLDMSEQLIVCQAVIKCMTQTMRKALIKMSISNPDSLTASSVCC